MIRLPLKYHKLLSQRHVFSSTAERTSDLANVMCVTRYVISEGHVSVCNMTLNIAALSRKGALCYQEASSGGFSLHNCLTKDTSETARACGFYCAYFIWHLSLSCLWPCNGSVLICACLHSIICMFLQEHIV